MSVLHTRVRLKNACINKGKYSKKEIGRVVNEPAKVGGGGKKPGVKGQNDTDFMGMKPKSDIVRTSFARDFHCEVTGASTPLCTTLTCCACEAAGSMHV